MLYYDNKKSVLVKEHFYNNLIDVVLSPYIPQLIC